MNQQCRLGTFLVAIVAMAAAAQSQVSLEWVDFHGPVPGESDQGQHAATDAAGNVCVTFVASKASGDRDVDVAKYSPAGTLLWTRRYDSGNSIYDASAGVEIAPNGDVWVCVNQENVSEFTLLRYDAAGNLLATIPSNIPGGDTAHAFAIDAQGTVYVAGHADGGQFYDMLIRAYSGSGSLLWDTRIDGAMGRRDNAVALVLDTAGSIFVAGSVENTSHDAAVAKLSPNGAVQWLKTVSQPNGDFFGNLASDRQGGVVACGSTEVSDFFGQTYTWGLVSRFDAAGNVLWNDPYPTGILGNSTTHVWMDEAGTTWALHAKDQFGDMRAHVTRLSPTGARLSAVDIPASDWPAGLVGGDAGQVFVAASANVFGPWPAMHGILCQFDSAGSLSWSQDIAFGASGAYLAGLEAAPRQRLALFGDARLGPSNTDLDGLAAQADVRESPHGFCVGKVNSLGCAPFTTFAGMPSAAASSGFTVRVQKVRNQTAGLFLYGLNGTASVPFGGGTLCIALPVRRTPGVHSGGAPGPAQDCSGAFSIDMNAFAQGALGGAPDPALSTAGTQVWMQAWGRDSGFPAPGNVALSGGLAYTVLP